MAQELKLHSPVGGESVVLQWPLSDGVSTVSVISMFSQCLEDLDCCYAVADCLFFDYILDMHHLVFGINSQIHFVSFTNLVLIRLFMHIHDSPHPLLPLSVTLGSEPNLSHKSLLP